MLLYVTAGEPQEREFRPLHTIPDTLAGLYDLGMRQHIRRAALLHCVKDEWQEMPDWRLDRLVIRLALHSRERLDVNPGDRIAIFGPLSWLWPAAEFAAVGFGCVAVGLSHLLSDGELSAALAECTPRVAFATDVESARRLMPLRAAAALPQTVIGPDDLAAVGPGLLPLGQVLELGSTLDTPERAQNFRACARGVKAESEAVWHFGRGESDNGPTLVRLTHGEAMALVKRRLARLPAFRADVAYLQAPEVTLAGRIAYHTFVGDGYTTTALAHAERTAPPEIELGGARSAATSEGGFRGGRERPPHDARSAPPEIDDLPLLRPHKAQVSEAWLASAWAQVLASSESPLRSLSRRLPRLRWLRALDLRGPWVLRAVRAALGSRLRCLEVPAPIEPEVAESLRRAGVDTVEVAGHDPSGVRPGPPPAAAAPPARAPDLEPESMRRSPAP